MVFIEPLEATPLSAMHFAAYEGHWEILKYISESLDTNIQGVSLGYL